MEKYKIYILSPIDGIKIPLRYLRPSDGAPIFRHHSCSQKTTVMEFDTMMEANTYIASLPAPYSTICFASNQQM